MAATAKGKFIPTNPQKYIGKQPITYRSGWELQFMRVLDLHPNVVGWSSESITIPYRNPLTGQMTVYVPDFLVVYLDRDGGKHCEMIEVKPLKETPGYTGKVPMRTKLVQAINLAKWQAAAAYCAKRNWRFRVATEAEMFAHKRKS
jgi:hypothetical protein